jgi:uncharacterized protein YggU (UPF0235/DUF167 family)
MKITIRLTPRSSQNKIAKRADGTYQAWVSRPPIEGAANEQLLSLLSDHFRVAPSRIRLVRGATSRTKIFELPD